MPIRKGRTWTRNPFIAADGGKCENCDLKQLEGTLLAAEPIGVYWMWELLYKDVWSAAASDFITYHTMSRTRTLEENYCILELIEDLKQVDSAVKETVPDIIPYSPPVSTHQNTANYLPESQLSLLACEQYISKQ